MEATKQTPGEVLLRQHGTIQYAANLLQHLANRMTSEFNPESGTWSDVAQYAHVEELAAAVIDGLENDWPRK